MSEVVWQDPLEIVNEKGRSTNPTVWQRRLAPLVLGDPS